MTHRVNASTVTRRHRALLERAYRDWLAEESGELREEWQQGFSAGLQHAKNVIRKGK